MKVTFRGGCLWLFALAGLGCGSKAVSVYPDAQAVDLGPTDINAPDQAVDVKPPPMSGGGNQRLYAGAAQIIAAGPPCTAEAGAATDRWCAFITAASVDFAQLLVVNVSKAAAGVAIACGKAGGDPNCLVLTRGFLEDADHAAGFQGDTLIYFDVTGTPYGWRPGMANGRALADSMNSLNVRNCFAARKGTAVMCLRDLSATDVIMSDLLAGRLDGPANPPLVRVETVISNNPNESPQRFQMGFPTPEGDFIAWSSRPTPTGPETLKVQRVDDATTRVTVASDVFQWSASPDGTRWYWLDHYAGVMGNLVSAPFPDGAAPTTLIPGVHDYVVSSSGTLAAVTAMLELKGIVDPVGAPATVASLETGVRGLLGIGDRGQVAYLKNFDVVFPISDMYVRRVDGTGRTCTLTSQIDGINYGVRFLPESAAVLWARVTTLDVPVGTLPPIDVALTNLSDCSKTVVASKANDGAWDLTAGEGIAVIDQADGRDGTLRLRGIVGGNRVTTDAPILVQSRVDGFASVFPVPPAVLFTVNAGSAADGLYVHTIMGSLGGLDAGTAGTDGMDGNGPADGNGPDGGTTPDNATGPDGGVD